MLQLHCSLLTSYQLQHSLSLSLISSKSSSNNSSNSSSSSSTAQHSKAAIPFLSF